MTTIAPAQNPNVFTRLLLALDKAVAMYLPLLMDCVKYKYRGAFRQPYSDAAKEVYRDHIRVVRSLIRDKDKYLEFDVKQGYGPLCEFLGKSTPMDDQGNVKAFPRVNDTGNFHDVFDGLFKAILLKRLTEWAGRVLGTAVIGCAAFWILRISRRHDFTSHQLG